MLRLCSVNRLQYTIAKLSGTSAVINAKCINTSIKEKLKGTECGQHSQHNKEILKEYYIFYKFPYVNLAGIVNRLKKYSTIVYSVGLPSCFVLTTFNIIEQDVIPTFFIVGLVTNAMLYSFGILSYKLIGALYLSSDETTVKISYLDFWGKRVNILCSLDDVVPISEVHKYYVLPFVKFKQYSTSRTLLLPCPYGNILNKDVFTRVFGSLHSF